jgi:Winged helix DNA-binding domain
VPATTITAAGLNRATLGRQLLLERGALGVEDAARRVVAIQAQQPASPYIALWNRLAGFDPADLDAAFTSRRLVKATLMRFTLHVVHASDHLALHTAMQPTLQSRLADPRYHGSGLRPADADGVIAELLAFASQPRTKAEAEAEEALQTLVQRYLAGFGPASVADVAQFALVQRSRARGALQALSGILEQLAGPGGTELFDIPGALRPPADTPAPPRLLPMWDSILLAYADRSRVIPPEFRAVVTRSNGDVLPTILVDGYVAGVWRTVDDGIEVTALRPLSAAAWRGLGAEARALTAFLAGRDARAYSRYHHWWAKLPGGEARILPR